MGRVIIHRPRPSVTAVRLAEGLRARGHDAVKSTRGRRPRPGSSLVSYGGFIDGVDGLNNTPLYGKLTELRLLGDAGVRCVEVCADTECQSEHLVRNRVHHGGLDLVNNTGSDFRVHRLPIDHEYRIHIWRDGDAFVSVRAGVKRPGGGDYHPWVRSHHAGWVVDYGAESRRSTLPASRELAKAAVSVLGLDFAGVDVAVLDDDTPVVLEVNRAPGLEGRTLDIYLDRIEKWLEEHHEAGTVGA